jgi:CTD kinase subunit gamma
MKASSTPRSSPESPPVKMMVDPFEVRMRFTTQLQHLSASVTSSQKAAHYALKYRDLDEDLHSCILEQIERVCASSRPHHVCLCLICMHLE